LKVVQKSFKCVSLLTIGLFIEENIKIIEKFN
jgi:hypothetical protein